MLCGNNHWTISCYTSTTTTNSNNNSNGSTHSNQGSDSSSESERKDPTHNPPPVPLLGPPQPNEAIQTDGIRSLPYNYKLGFS